MISAESHRTKIINLKVHETLFKGQLKKKKRGGDILGIYCHSQYISKAKFEGQKFIRLTISIKNIKENFPAEK